MTQLRKDPDALSNHFDELFKGIGHRGSSFTDADGIVHDGRRRRFLVMEWKREGEHIDQAQAWAFKDLADLPRVDVWYIRLMNDGTYRWVDAASRKKIDGVWSFTKGGPLSADELKDKFRDWWA